FSPFADFTGSDDLRVNTNAGVTWQAISNSILCGGGGIPLEFFGSAAGTPGARFLCRVSSLQVETVGGARLAYFDANVIPHFDYNRDNPATRTVTTRFYFQIRSGCSAPASTTASGTGRQRGKGS